MAKRRRKNPGMMDQRVPYHGSFRLKGYNGAATIFTAVSNSDRFKVLKKLFPTYTKADHIHAYNFHNKAEKRYEKLWSRTVDKASRETFGRLYQFGDYKISAIARDEYPERYKKILRMAAQRGSQHSTLAAAHMYAAQHMRK